MILTTTHALGSVLGFGLAKFIAGKKAGYAGRIKSIRFDIKSYTLHLHHWFLSSLFLVILVSLNFYHHLVYSFLIGAMIQGLTYRDFFKIVYRS